MEACVNTANFLGPPQECDTTFFPNAIISGKRQHTSFGFSSQNTIFCAIALRHLLGPFALRIGGYELPVFQYDFGDIVQAVNTVNNKYIIANTPL